MEQFGISDCGFEKALGIEHGEMQLAANRLEAKIRGPTTEDRRQNFETWNPPEGWESEGQLRN